MIMLRFFIYIGVVLGSLAGIIITILGSLLLSTPRPDDIRDCITAKMYNVRLCPRDKTYTRLKNISPYIKHAVLVSEDSGFYTHKGFDFEALKLSFEANLKQGKYVRGGSTITQQLAKNVYLSAEKSLLRKAREALITLQLEKILSKDEILEKYLNVVEFGPGVYGVHQAARFYFGKSPSEVTVLEGAWLAFVLPNPKKYSTSFRKHELTRFARNQLRIIVGRMGRFQRIPQEEADAALAQLESMFKPAAETDWEDDLEIGTELESFEEEMSTVVDENPDLPQTSSDDNVKAGDPLQSDDFE